MLINHAHAPKKPININFTDHIIDIEKDTTIYMFSDGYQDQFGGSDNKKFMSSKFKDMLLKNQKSDMHEQLKILDSTFEKWKGNKQQIDDVLVIGFRLNDI